MQEENWILVNFRSAWREPGDIHNSDAVGSRYRALRGGFAVWEELGKKAHNPPLAARMSVSRRRAHEDVTVAISLDAVWKFRENRIGQNLAPASQVEPGLRLKVRELDGDRHAEKVRQEWGKSKKSKCRMQK